MDLMIVRHAQTMWNVERRIQGWTNSQLTPHGTLQAQAVAERLRTAKIDAIYSSDAQRAVRTAECVALWHETKVITTPGLRETGWGEWEGMTGDEIAERFPNLWQKFVAQGQEKSGDESDWDATTLVPGGESPQICAARIADALQEIRSKHTEDHERVLVVGHGGSLRFLFTLALGVRPMLARRFHLDNTSLSEIRFAKDDHPVIRLLNDTSHLVGALAP
jgi:broad specificity phosphatase PhoE